MEYSNDPEKVAIVVETGLRVRSYPEWTRDALLLPTKESPSPSSKTPRSSRKAIGDISSAVLKVDSANSTLAVNEIEKGEPPHCGRLALRLGAVNGLPRYRPFRLPGRSPRPASVLPVARLDGPLLAALVLVLLLLPSRLLARLAAALLTPLTRTAALLAASPLDISPGGARAKRNGALVTIRAGRPNVAQQRTRSRLRRRRR